MLRDNLFLASLGVLIALVLVVLGLVLYFAVRRSATKASSDPKIARLRFDSLRSSFRQAVELIEQNIASRSERYSIPWVMVLNEGASQHQLPIEQSGVASALSTEAAMAATAQGLSWHFFDRGVVIDIQGAYLGSPDDEDAAEKPWDEFLGLCRKYRPQRPFDSVVITVPAGLLLDDNPDARLELGKLAKLAHRRLWLAQNRFAMRFAVYVVVSECEEIEGFTQFARAVPEAMRASMLGWSSPFDLSTTYQSAWVRDGVDAVVRTVSDTSAELFALNTAAEDAGKFFLLPSRIDKIKSQLQLYVDELMRPSAYHEPFFFRGIYLTGDSSESAQKALSMESGAVAGEVSPESGADLVSQLMREPAFLRDLFEKKIFLEYGLARPSRQQLSRPVLSRAMRWAAIAILGTWSIGLVVATVQLDTRHTELAKAIEQLQADANFRAKAAERGEVIPTDWYRRKALALLAAIEKLGVDTPWTVFMPGSWHMFDDLEERAAERIEREFGEIAINTLRRELYARAADLTGVSQDTSTAELIIGGECAVPSGIAAIAGAPRRATLAVEDLPEFSAMLQYLSSVEQLDHAIQAMLRLQKPSQNEANDLRLLVKYALGAELPGNISRSIMFFRGGPATLSLTPIQQAVRCTLGKGMSALETRLFGNNDLLVSEQRLSKLAVRLFVADGAPTGFAQTVDAYRDVLAAIKEQEVLLASGKGGWMRQLSLNLGAAYDRLMVRIAQVRLMGPDVADQSRLQTALAFQRFSADFSARLGGDAQGGVIWLDKEARFTLSSDRLALRDALVGLLNQPFMTNPRDRELPDVATSQASIVWDTQRLDQALALGDVRKRYMTEGLPKFPPAVRASVEAFVNAQFARLVSDQVNEALSVTARPEPGAAADVASFDASRSRLIKIQALLGELGARGKADDLRGLISRDAIARLRYVDESLSRSELYSIRGRDFKSWNGEKGPLLQAFGVQDVAGMQQYLAQQFNRADTLDKQAESYIASLDLPAPGPITLRWQAIHRDLERYRLKNPNSSLVLLEQFLLTLGPELDRSNCTEKLAGKGPGSRAADYFAERYQHIYTSLVARCGELRARDQQEQWASFAGNFNRAAAGRLPFSQSVSRDVAPADFDEVGQLIKSFDRAARTLKDITADVGVRSSQQSLAAKRFVDQFERAKAFLLPLYPTEDGAASGYDVAVEFRANQQAEIDGNKVIDWTLEIGGQVLRLRDGPKVLKWEPGTPVTLTLRLAKDSPVVPVPDPQQPALLADGKAVVFRYMDPWALITMIQRQREPDGSLRADTRSQLLRMDFPLVNVSGNDLRAQGIEARSRVYLRLTLSAVGKKTPVAWPGLFPVRAPEWTRP